MSPLLRICTCGALTERTPCPNCRTTRNTQRRQRPTWATVYNTARWRKLRAAILRRDDHTCQQCGNEATTAGHITPFADASDPAAWDTTNIEAQCLRCNSSEAARRRT